MIEPSVIPHGIPLILLKISDTGCNDICYRPECACRKRVVAGCSLPIATEHSSSGLDDHASIPNCIAGIPSVSVE